MVFCFDIDEKKKSWNVIEFLNDTLKIILKTFINSKKYIIENLPNKNKDLNNNDFNNL